MFVKNGGNISWNLSKRRVESYLCSTSQNKKSTAGSLRDRIQENIKIDFQKF